MRGGRKGQGTPAAELVQVVQSMTAHAVVCMEPSPAWGSLCRALAHGRLCYALPTVHIFLVGQLLVWLHLATWAETSFLSRAVQQEELPLGARGAKQQLYLEWPYSGWGQISGCGLPQVGLGPMQSAAEAAVGLIKSIGEP